METFKNYCTCGGFAGLSERAKSKHPHLEWCAQFAEYEEWLKLQQSPAAGLAATQKETEHV